VIVYATGGLVATNLKDGDLTLGDFPNRKFDLRKSSLDKSTFQNWCEQNAATVFQTHLLAYKNQLKIASNSSNAVAKRMMLAVGKINGHINHILIRFDKNDLTLHDAARNFYSILKNSYSMDIVYIINLDPGAQDVFKLYDSDGDTDYRMYGTQDIDKAANLLVYYYE
jgi:hypothetical protein